MVSKTTQVNSGMSEVNRRRYDTFHLLAKFRLGKGEVLPLLTSHIHTLCTYLFTPNCLYKAFHASLLNTHPKYYNIEVNESFANQVWGRERIPSVRVVEENQEGTK